MADGIVKPGSNPVYFGIRINFVTGHTRQEVPPNLASALNDRLQIGLCRVIPANQVSNGLPHGHRSVAITELPVIILFKNRTHRMVLYRKSINYGICNLDIVTQKIVKAVLVNAFSRSRAIEAP